MIIKTFYKNNFTYIDSIYYFELCKDDNLLVLEGKNIHTTISKIDRAIIMNDDGKQLELINFK